jgi:transcriptional regulator with XRE-family HTH domain
MLNTDYVQELIDKHGWSLGQLAARSGVSKAQLSRIFSEKRGAGARTMEGILRAFPEADKNRLFLPGVLPKSNNLTKSSDASHPVDVAEDTSVKRPSPRASYHKKP